MTESTSIQASSTSVAHANPWSCVCLPNSGATGSEFGQLHLDMVHARLGSISSLYVALRAKHGPAASHSLRVALWASAWGISCKLGEEHLQLFETVGLLHEIGKIGIPDRVLQKPEKLTEGEKSMMDLHIQVGAEILRAAGASNDLMLSIGGIGTRFHSSNDSNSTEIAPLASRLINIIDAYDSMTMQQVYREPMSREAALAEIFRQSGIQFDPRLVRSFADVVLNPKSNVMELAAQRWLKKIDTTEESTFFDLGQSYIQSSACQSKKSGSVLVHKLNDTFYRHMMDHIQDGVIFVDSEFRVLDWNSTAERMTGKSASSVYHQTWNTAFASLCDSEGFGLDASQCPFAALMRNGQVISERYAIRRDGIPMLHVKIDVIPVFNDAGHLCGGAMILEDISETAVLEQKIVHLRERASQDQLTKVANRGELNRQLPDFVEYHQQNNRVGSVIICDIDFFKRINDNFSHQVGDEALIVFAKVLKESCRETDFVARFGGEEFVMLCSECDFSEAKEWAETIRKKLQRTPIAAIRNACITASFGVSTVLPGDTGETVLERADQALLIAKDTGRDRVVGLGLDSKSTGISSAKNEQNPSGSRGWFGWLSPSVSFKQQYELLTNVPRDVTLEKLKGFVSEFNAFVIDVGCDKIVLEVDCRRTPIPQTKNERLGKFVMEIGVTELEMNAGGKKGNVKTCTLLELLISPVRGRDRRSDALVSQALRLKTAFQGVMVAHEMDEELEGDIVRRIKPEKESRY